MPEPEALGATADASVVAAIEGWAQVEAAAALTVSHRRASGQMTVGLALRRLPRLAALGAAGRLSARLAAVIAWRTYLITDPQALAAVDAALAEQAGGWGPLSVTKLEQAIDSITPAATRTAESPGWSWTETRL